MSLKAVHDFFAKIAETPKCYRALTEGFFGFNARKVVILAALLDYDFTLEELEEARLTNKCVKHAMASLRVDDEVDLEPAPFPHPPYDSEEFFEEHGRHVYAASGPTVSNPERSRKPHKRAGK